MDLGFLADDARVFWWMGSVSHPVIYLDGRFVDYVVKWTLWNLFEHHPGAFHVLQIGLHLLVVNELMRVSRSLRINGSIAAVVGLLSGVSPVYYETLYWLQCIGYMYPSICFLLSIRFFIRHLHNGKLLLLVSALVLYFLACGTVEFMWPLCVVFSLLHWHFVSDHQLQTPLPFDC